MAIEKKWPAVAPRLLAADGGLGTIQLANTSGFKVKQTIALQSSTQPTLQLKIQKATRTVLRVTLPSQQPNAYAPPLDLTAYTLADGAFVTAEEQPKANLSFEDRDMATYDQEPTVARRNVLVDQYGDYYDVANPMPVQLSDGSINIGTVNAELEVQLSHQDNTPDVGDVADSVQVGDGVDVLQVNPDGSINVVLQGSGGTAVLYTGEALAVAAAVQTTVLSHTVPPATYLTIDRIDVGGENIAKWEVYINAVKIATRRTYWGDGMNESFIMGGLKADAGDTIEVKVLHDRPFSGDFEANLIGKSN